MATLNENIFTGLFWTAQLLALVNIVLVLVWTNNFLGGFAWQNDPLHEFNYHIVFAVIGQVVLYGEGIIFHSSWKHKSYEFFIIQIILKWFKLYKKGSNYYMNIISNCLFYFQLVEMVLCTMLASQRQISGFAPLGYTKFAALFPFI